MYFQNKTTFHHVIIVHMIMWNKFLCRFSVPGTDEAVLNSEYVQDAFEQLHVQHQSFVSMLHTASRQKCYAAMNMVYADPSFARC